MKKQINTTEVKNRERLEKMQKDAKLQNAVNVKAIETMSFYLAKDENAFGKSLMVLSTIMVHKHLNRLNGGSFNDEKKTFNDGMYNQSLSAFKNDITIAGKWTIMLETLDTLYIEYTNKDGNIVIECTDKEREGKILTNLANISACVGNDIVSECITAIMRYIRIAEKNGAQIDENFLLKPMTTYDKRTKHNADGTLKPKALWKKIPTNGIKEGNKAISRYINRNRAHFDNTVLWVEVEKVIEKEDGTTETECKAVKASPISAYLTTDINGAPIALTANESSEELIRSIPARAKLNERERAVFVYRYMKNMTIREIAEKQNRTQEKIERTLSRITDKIIEANIFAQYTKEDRREGDKAKAIYCYLENDENKRVIYTFDSIKKASEILNIDRASISKVVSGQRKSANGLIFARVNG